MFYFLPILLSGEEIPDRALTNDAADTQLTADDGVTYIIADQAHIGCDSASFALTGREVLYPKTVVATQQTYTLTGQAAGMVRALKMAATQATFTQTGYGAGLDVGLPAVQASFALTGQGAGLRAGRKIVATVATFAQTGYAAGLDVAVPAVQASYSLTGYDVALDYVPDEGNPPLTADTQTYTLTGNAALLVPARILLSDAQTFALTGNAAGTVAARKAAAAAATYSLTGTATGLAVVRRMAAAQATFTWTGQAASFTKTGPVMPAVRAEYFLTGINVRPVKQSGAVYVIT